MKQRYVQFWCELVINEPWVLHYVTPFEEGLWISLDHKQAISGFIRFLKGSAFVWMTWIMWLPILNPLVGRPFCLGRSGWNGGFSNNDSVGGFLVLWTNQYKFAFAIDLLWLGVLLLVFWSFRKNRDAIWEDAKRTTPSQFPSMSQLQALDSVPLSLVKAEADLVRKRWSSKQKVKPVSSVSTEEQQHRRDGGDEMSSGSAEKSKQGQNNNQLFWMFMYWK